MDKEMLVSFPEEGPQPLIQELSNFCEHDPLLKHIPKLPSDWHMLKFENDRLKILYYSNLFLFFKVLFVSPTFTGNLKLPLENLWAPWGSFYLLFPNSSLPCALQKLCSGFWDGFPSANLLLFKNNFIYLFFAVLGFSLVVASGVYSLVAVHRLLIVVPSLW